MAGQQAAPSGRSRGAAPGSSSATEGSSEDVTPSVVTRRRAATGSSARDGERGRVLLVSNRLPVSVRAERGQLQIERSAGGLATGLSGFHARGDTLWIGWPGETWRLTPEQLSQANNRLAELRAVPIELTAAEVQRYYDGFSNGVLWPLLHYDMNRLPMNAEGWNTYRRVNQRFADAVVAHYRPGDLIWIHDYQLALVPELVRRKLPDAAIGFFLHVPFPSAEVFRLLPWRRELLEGMLGASLIGFHTVSYVLHFLTSAANVLGCETRQGRVYFAGRSVKVGTYAMGIDAAGYEAVAARPEVIDEAERLRQSAGDVALIVSVDRLDYTKGIPRRLYAFERLLERYPRLRGRVRLIQVASPSRVNVGEYRDFRRSVDEIVGRINGRFSLLGHDPIHYISQTLPPEGLVAIYRAARVALITPLRDGMNLVAKEFVASRTDEDGVLVLSEFAGAAAELTDAILVNPYDLDGVAAAIKQALEMPLDQRRTRMRRMRQQVKVQDVEHWARDFVAALRAESRHRPRPSSSAASAGRPEEIASAAVENLSHRLILLLDYDGTLVGLRPTPSEASPDSEILKLLAGLAILPGLQVHVISGRRRDDLDLWLGALPIGLHAEHGLWSRDASERRWRRRDVGAGWLEKARALIEQKQAAVPGSAVEHKDASVAWHYRNVADSRRQREAASLTRRLTRELSGTSASILHGNRVVEVKDAEISKGGVVRELVDASPGARLVVIGDDVTDEDMFLAAPADALTVKVGSGTTAARMRLAGPDQVRRFLVDLEQRLADRGHVGSAALGDPIEEPVVPVQASGRSGHAS
jgi:trehalose 6-phosphate synthase/phosphatase